MADGLFTYGHLSEDKAKSSRIVESNWLPKKWISNQLWSLFTGFGKTIWWTKKHMDGDMTEETPIFRPQNKSQEKAGAQGNAVTRNIITR